MIFSINFFFKSNFIFYLCVLLFPTFLENKFVSGGGGMFLSKISFHVLWVNKANKATRSISRNSSISREQVQKLTPQFLLYIYWI